MDTRLQQLATFISRDLSNPHLPRSHIRTNVQRLIRLGMGEHARDTFLAARSSLIRQRVKQLAFEGDTMQYINELSFIVFTLLKHSCAWFVASFKEPRMSSGFIKWLKGELENYATIFRCQVFHDGQQFATIADCMASTVYHCQTLADVGLDVGFLFGQNFFHRDVAQSIELHRTRMLGAVSKAIADDEFTSLIVTEEFDGGLSTTRTSTLAPATTAGLSAIPSYYATPSCAMFKSTVLTFLTDLAPLVTNALYTETVESVQNFFETYFRHMMDLSHAQHMDRQRLLLVVNVTYLSMHVFPCLRSVLSSEPLSQTAGQAATLSAASKTKHIHRFGRPIPELDKLQVRLASMRAIILQAFHQRRATKLAVDTFAFGPVCLGDKARSTPAPAATATALPSASPTSPSKRVGGKFGTTVAPTYGTGNWMDYSSDIYPISEQSFPSDNMLRFIKELHGLALLVDDVTAEFKGVPEKLLPIDKKTVVQGVLEAFFADITEGR